MLRHNTLKLLSLILANVLLPIAVLCFASGFFPYKPVLPGLAKFEDVEEPGLEIVEAQPAAVFNRVIFMVVDALRSDFVYGYNSGFEFTQSLIRSGAAIPFTAHATPPTVTMPRVKALTTGSVPSFLDLILNFAESDTSSSLAAQDTWLAQLRARKGNGSLVFYGDDTWLKLFPGDFFARADGTSSFFVSDFTEVDNNVTRHVPHELAQPDWSAMIMHYLGMDHIGHKTGPQGPNMIPKQREMDSIVRQIYEAIETAEHHTDTLFVLAGDHGMNAGGNHGGSGPGETEPALLFASPKFAAMERHGQYECPTHPKQGTDFHYHTKLEQSDLVPTLASLMGLPIPKNSLGVYIREFAGVWKQRDLLRLLGQNARQILHVVRAKYGSASFDNQVKHYFEACQGTGVATAQNLAGDEAQLAHDWAMAKCLLDNGESGADHDRLAEDALYAFLYRAQEAMSDTASSYDVSRMSGGIIIAGSALLLSLDFSNRSFASVFFAIACTLYGLMMFASSYVEEEQHFWYWLTPVWFALLGTHAYAQRAAGNKRLTAMATGVLLVMHRVSTRWNQTGQKHAGEPDIVHTFFPEHHIIMWLLIWTTYILIGFYLHNRTFAGIFMPELAAFTNVSLVVPAIVFKLNFAYADSPELVKTMAHTIREWSAPFDLVFQARAVFLAIAVTAAAVIFLSIWYSRKASNPNASDSEEGITLVERLHPLLTLFLMTQTRAPNIPLFLVLELQYLALIELFKHAETSEKPVAASWQLLSAKIVTTTLLASHVSYFCMGGSNSISSIDLSNAYNGVADYNIAAVGLLLFASNWAGPIWWCSAAVLLLIPRAPSPPATPQTQSNGSRSWVLKEHAHLKEAAVNAVNTVGRTQATSKEIGNDAWRVYVAHMTGFIASGLLAVMAACTVLRTHLFIWTVFSPKYLYAMAWSAGWHLVINIGLGSLLRSAACIV